MRKLSEGRHLYESMHVLEAVIALWDKTFPPATSSLSFTSYLAHFASKHAQSLAQLVGSTLIKFTSNAARWMEERRALIGSAAQHPSGSSQGQAALVLTPPGQGSFAYAAIVASAMRLLRTLATGGCLLPPDSVLVLWDSLVLRPNVPEDVIEVRRVCCNRPFAHLQHMLWQDLESRLEQWRLLR